MSAFAVTPVAAVVASAGVVAGAAAVAAVTGAVVVAAAGSAVGIAIVVVVTAAEPGPELEALGWAESFESKIHRAVQVKSFNFSGPLLPELIPVFVA